VQRLRAAQIKRKGEFRGEKGGKFKAGGKAGRSYIPTNRGSCETVKKSVADKKTNAKKESWTVASGESLEGGANRRL